MARATWHPLKDSNLDQRFWRPVCCHYTKETNWLRGTDSNRRSSGYEPGELPLLHPAINGRSTRIRTLDPLVPNQVRYQTALHSELTWYDMWYVWNCSRTAVELFEKFFSLLRCIRIDSFLFFTLRCANCCFVHWHIIILTGGS